MKTFSIIFISIVLEAMPFIFLGTLISAIIEVLIPSEWLNEKLKNRKLRYYFVAGLIGIIMPVCECAIIPIMRRLVKKGIPVGVAMTFMLSTPIVNPIVMLSTYYAFSGDWYMVLGRVGLGYIAAIVIGLVMGYWTQGEAILKDKPADHDHDHDHSCDHSHDHDHSHHHQHDHAHHHESESDCFCSCCGHDHQEPLTLGPLTRQQKIKSGLKHILEHLSGEFIEVSQFLMLGAFIAALMQTFIPQSWFLSLGSNPLLAVLIMMVLAFVMSLCSEADAFIASTFRNHFPNGAIMAFLIFGPMMDIKNTLMLAGSFKKGFIVKLISSIFVICFFLASLFSLIY